MAEQEKGLNAKYKLAASIKECMKTTPVDRITVKDIVEGCGLTRQTFYRNFKDKYDLINWYFDKLVLQSFEQIGVGHTVGESLTQKFEFIRSEKAFFTEAFRFPPLWSTMHPAPATSTNTLQKPWALRAQKT